MIKDVANKAYNGIFGGLLLFLAAFAAAVATHLFIPLPGHNPIFLAFDVIAIFFPFILLLASAVIFGRGCWMYTVAKGHSGWLGLVGLFPMIGWIVLCIIPDNQKFPDAQGFPVVDPE